MKRFDGPQSDTTPSILADPQRAKVARQKGRVKRTIPALALLVAVSCTAALEARDIAEYIRGCAETGFRSGTTDLLDEPTLLRVTADCAERASGGEIESVFSASENDHTCRIRDAGTGVQAHVTVKPIVEQVRAEVTERAN